MEQIFYGFYRAPMGEMVIAKSSRGLCWLGFMVQGYKGDGLSRMKAHFQNVEFIHDDAALKPLGDEVVRAWEEGREKDIALDLRGSEFQKSVWAALLEIGRGDICSYARVANDIGKPKAVRAVGSAVGENPVSLIVPCHRVVRSDGGLGNYGWGLDLKETLLREEGITNLKHRA